MSIIEDFADINKRLKELKPESPKVDQSQQSQVLSGAEWLNELRSSTSWPSHAHPDLIGDQQADSIDYTCFEQHVAALLRDVDYNKIVKYIQALTTFARNMP